jgi:hypothetical protein
MEFLPVIIGVAVGFIFGGFAMYSLMSSSSTPTKVGIKELPLGVDLVVLAFYFPGKGLTKDKNLFDPSVLLELSTQHKKYLVHVDLTKCADMWSLQHGDILVRKGCLLRRKPLDVEA